MPLPRKIFADLPAVEAFCRRHGIRRLSLLGSASTDRFGPDRDVDLLAEFVPGRTPGLLGLVHELELCRILGGRDVELRTYGEDLETDEMLRLAIVKLVESIGEAANRTVAHCRRVILLTSNIRCRGGAPTSRP